MSTMRIKLVFLFTPFLASSSGAFVVTPPCLPGMVPGNAEAIVVRRPSNVVVVRMSDFDFPSAMPEKPQLTREQRMEQSADEFIEAMTNALGEGVESPPELEALKEARANGGNLPLRIYELMIERGMLYDEAPEVGTLTLTEFDIPSNLDVNEVKDEFFHLYKYGMTLMENGLLTEDEVKTTVIERLIKRTGLSPEEFDKWLGY